METKIADLAPDSLDIFFFLNACLVIFYLFKSQSQVLILEKCFEHLDIKNRNKITQWLVENSDFNIIIDLTNRVDVISLYPRHLHFEDGKLVEDNRKNVIKVKSKMND